MSNSDKISFLNNKKAVLASYEKNGFHIEESLLTPTECKTLIDEGLTLSDGQTYTPYMMPHRKSALFLKALKHPKVAEIISCLVGGEAVGIQSEFFYCKPGTRGFSLHQDNFYVEAAYGVFASAWIALTDVYYAKGSLIVYPESHKEGALPVEKLNMDRDANQDPNANNEQVIVPSQYRPINVQVPQGSVVFLHGHTVHGSNPNTTNEWRFVVLNTYIKKGEAFRPGNYAKREAVDLAA